MRNAAIASVQKSAWILSPAQIKSLEGLGENERRDALMRLGASQIRRAQEEWRRRGSDAFDQKKKFLEGQDYFFAVTESRDERREYEKRIEDAASDIKQADSIVEILDRYIAIVEKSDVEAILVARAAELRADKQRYLLLKELNGTFANAAAILSKIQQHNAEAREINGALPGGGELVPILDVPLKGLPGQHSLITWLTGLFPIRGLEESVTIRWLGRTGYPKVVQEVLAKLDEEKRAAIAAARKRPWSSDANDPGSATRTVHTMPRHGAVPEAGQAEEDASSDRSLGHVVHRPGSGD